MSTKTDLQSFYTLQQVEKFKPIEYQSAITLPNQTGNYYGDSIQSYVGASGETTAGSWFSTSSSTTVTASSDLPVRIPNGKGISISVDGQTRFGGHWSRGKRHGRGCLISPELDYEGEWWEDQMHGKCKIHYKKTPGLWGAIKSLRSQPKEFAGDIHRDHGIHGTGNMSYTNGETYEGEWFRGKRTGKGVQTTQEGERYEGQFEDDERHGTGVLALPSGAQYLGMFSHGRRHGHGKMLRQNGDVYVGDFLSDEMQGNGVMTYKNGDTYSGEWKYNTRHGRGVFRLAEKEAVVSGTFVSGLLQGDGTVEIPGKSIFVGEFLQGERIFGTMWLEKPKTSHENYHHQHGNSSSSSSSSAKSSSNEKTSNKTNQLQPSSSSSSSSTAAAAKSSSTSTSITKSQQQQQQNVNNFCAGVYHGPFRGDGVHGNGLFWYPDGSFYCGSWVNGRRQGKGYMRHADGTEYSGEFYNDERRGRGMLRLPSGQIACGIFDTDDTLAVGYFGEWNPNKQQLCGRGVFIEENGAIYEGLVQSSRREMLGTISVAVDFDRARNSVMLLQQQQQQQNNESQQKNQSQTQNNSNFHRNANNNYEAAGSGGMNLNWPNCITSVYPKFAAARFRALRTLAVEAEEEDFALHQQQQQQQSQRNASASSGGHEVSSSTSSNKNKESFLSTKEKLERDAKQASKRNAQFSCLQKMHLKIPGVTSSISCRVHNVSQLASPSSQTSTSTSSSSSSNKNKEGGGENKNPKNKQQVVEEVMPALRTGGGGYNNDNNNNTENSSSLQNENININNNITSSSSSLPAASSSSSLSPLQKAILDTNSVRLTYRGGFASNSAHGEGTLVLEDSDGTVLACYSGMWAGGEPCGGGVVTGNLLGKRFFTGDWLRGHPHGEGRLYDPGVDITCPMPELPVQTQSTLQRLFSLRSSQSLQAEEEFARLHSIRRGIDRQPYVISGKWHSGQPHGDILVYLTPVVISSSSFLSFSGKNASNSNNNNSSENLLKAMMMQQNFDGENNNDTTETFMRNYLKQKLKIQETEETHNCVVVSGEEDEHNSHSHSHDKNNNSSESHNNTQQQQQHSSDEAMKKMRMTIRRIVQVPFLNGQPRIIFPHAPSHVKAPPADLRPEEKCPKCDNTYNILRLPVRCRCCAELGCTSCCEKRLVPISAPTCVLEDFTEAEQIQQVGHDEHLPSHYDRSHHHQSNRHSQLVALKSKHLKSSSSGSKRSDEENLSGGRSSSQQQKSTTAGSRNNSDVDGGTDTDAENTSSDDKKKKNKNIKNNGIDNSFDDPLDAEKETSKIFVRCCEKCSHCIDKHVSRVKLWETDAQLNVIGQCNGHCDNSGTWSGECSVVLFFDSQKKFEQQKQQQTQNTSSSSGEKQDHYHHHSRNSSCASAAAVASTASASNNFVVSNFHSHNNNNNNNNSNDNDPNNNYCGDIQFIGNFLNGKRNGFGTLILTHLNGEGYRGSWLNDKRHGEGIYRFSIIVDENSSSSETKQQQHQGEEENIQQQKEGDENSTSSSRAHSLFMAVSGEWYLGDLVTLRYFGTVRSNDWRAEGKGIGYIYSNKQHNLYPHHHQQNDNSLDEKNNSSENKKSEKNQEKQETSASASSTNEQQQQQTSINNAVVEVYNGSWFDGRPNGIGISTILDPAISMTREATFVGTFKNGLRHGSGRSMCPAQGRITHGVWNEGKCEGRCHIEDMNYHIFGFMNHGLLEGAVWTQFHSIPVEIDSVLLQQIFEQQQSTEKVVFDNHNITSSSHQSDSSSAAAISLRGDENNNTHHKSLLEHQHQHHRQEKENISGEETTTTISHQVDVGNEIRNVSTTTNNIETSSHHSSKVKLVRRCVLYHNNQVQKNCLTSSAVSSSSSSDNNKNNNFLSSILAKSTTTNKTTTASSETSENNTNNNNDSNNCQFCGTSFGFVSSYLLPSLLGGKSKTFCRCCKRIACTNCVSKQRMLPRHLVVAVSSSASTSSTSTKEEETRKNSQNNKNDTEIVAESTSSSINEYLPQPICEYCDSLLGGENKHSANNNSYNNNKNIDSNNKNNNNSIIPTPSECGGVALGALYFEDGLVYVGTLDGNTATIPHPGGFGCWCRRRPQQQQQHNKNISNNNNEEQSSSSSSHSGTVSAAEGDIISKTVAGFPFSWWKSSSDHSSSSETKKEKQQFHFSYSPTFEDFEIWWKEMLQSLQQITTAKTSSSNNSNLTSEMNLEMLLSLSPSILPAHIQVSQLNIKKFHDIGLHLNASNNTEITNNLFYHPTTTTTGEEEKKNTIILSSKKHGDDEEDDDSDSENEEQEQEEGNDVDDQAESKTAIDAYLKATRNTQHHRGPSSSSSSHPSTSLIKHHNKLQQQQNKNSVSQRENSTNNNNLYKLFSPTQVPALPETKPRDPLPLSFEEVEGALTAARLHAAEQLGVIDEVPSASSRDHITGYRLGPSPPPAPPLRTPFSMSWNYFETVPLPHGVVGHAFSSSKRFHQRVLASLARKGRGIMNFHPFSSSSSSNNNENKLDLPSEFYDESFDSDSDTDTNNNANNNNNNNKNENNAGDGSSGDNINNNLRSGNFDGGDSSTTTTNNKQKRKMMASSSSSPFMLPASEGPLAAANTAMINTPNFAPHPVKFLDDNISVPELIHVPSCQSSAKYLREKLLLLTPSGSKNDDDKKEKVGEKLKKRNKNKKQETFHNSNSNVSSFVGGIKIIIEHSQDGIGAPKSIQIIDV